MSQVIDDVATYLQAQGIGTLGTDLFESFLPTSPDNAVAVLETAGLKPTIDAPLFRPSFQILVRATDYATGRTKCDAIKTALHNQYNLQLVTNGIYFYFIRLITEGGHIGQDGTGRDLFSLNFETERR